MWRWHREDSGTEVSREMSGRQERWQEDLFVAAPLSSLVPDDHILKQVDQVLGQVTRATYYEGPK